MAQHRSSGAVVTVSEFGAVYKYSEPTRYTKFSVPVFATIFKKLAQFGYVHSCIRLASQYCSTVFKIIILEETTCENVFAPAGAC